MGQPYYDPNNTAALPPEYRPLSPWAYFGYSLLFSIPVIGFIMLIVFSCGGTVNINLRNYARSYFCIIGLTLVILAFTLVISIIAGLSLSDLSNTISSSL